MRPPIVPFLILLLNSSYTFTTGFAFISTIQLPKGKLFIRQPLVSPSCAHHGISTKRWAKKVKKRADVDQLQEAEVENNLFTFADYKDELEALLYLSRVVSDDPRDLCERAQQVFDNMYENWAINDKDELEPTTEIYNLLISIYASCGDLSTASKILSRMEHGQQDEVPSTDVHTYISMMEGCEQSGKITEAEDFFHRASKTNSFDVILYNSMLSIWKRRGDLTSPRKAEMLLENMISGQDQEPILNTETFALVMECLCRNTSKAKRPLVFQKVQSLVDTMKTLQGNGNENVNPNDKKIINAMIKALGYSKLPDKIIKAENLLSDMMERYELSRDEEECPNAATFINTINICSSNQSAESAHKASVLLTLMNNMYQMTKERGEHDCEDLKPTVRVYNAVMNVWSRSNAHDKAVQAKSLLDTLNSEWKKRSSDEDLAPNQRSYNTVINACAYTTNTKKGSSAKDRSEALRIMVETFNAMRLSPSVEPNHVTYGLFLKGCYNLMPNDDKRETIVENIFRKCCKEGCVSEFVLDTLFESASPSFLNGIFGDSQRTDIHIPAEWSENV